MSNQSVNPRSGEVFGPIFPATTPAEVSQMIESAVKAFGPWSQMGGVERGRILSGLADAIDAQSEKLIEIADSETGLGKARLTGEVGRTTFQIRSFAAEIAKGESFFQSVDAAVDAPLPAGHPKFIRVLTGIGPVAVFGASNFPFAFSILGGDTASALAAGCSVVIKAHPAHPQTSQLTFDIALEFLLQAGAPRGVIGLGHGFDFGKAIINDPRIMAGAFTGSRQGGRALFDMAQAREVPIPFYGELGSVNPVVVLQSALSDSKAFAGAYLDSLLMGNGQFCTNPSLLFIPEAGTLAKEISEELMAREPAPFLSQATKELHDKNRAALLERTKATVIPGKSAPEVGFYSTPEVLLVKASEIAENPEQLSIECFGPTGVLITYADIEEVLEILRGLEGALAGALFSAPDDLAAHSLSMALAAMTGRVALNAWPTGVSVTPGQHHGGPYPASTSPLHTSVGISAITRFLRPVTFQGFPTELLVNVAADVSKGE